jgi:HK97 family phage portal protein
MGVFSRAEQRFYQPTSAGNPWTIPPNSALAPLTTAGVAVDEESAMQLIAAMACVRLVSNSVANLPFNAVRQDGQIKKIVASPTVLSDPFGGVATPGLLRRREGIVQIMVSLLLRGNAYMIVTAYNDAAREFGKPTRLRVIHPDRVSVEWDDEGKRAYKVDRKPIDASDIVHITGLSFPEAAAGMSVIAYARHSIGLGLAAEEFGASLFGKGAHMTGIVSVESNLDPTTAKQMKEAFEASHSGLKNAHSVGILSGGAKWTPITMTPEDAQFLGTRAAQNLDMAMLFGVPPHMLGQTDKTTSWGTGIEQQTLGYLGFTLEDWLGRLEDAWTPMLPTALNACFDRDAVLKSDAAGRFAVYSAARTAALMTPNEIRAKENLPPIEGGDDIAFGLNSTVSAPKDIGAKTSMTSDGLGQVL